MRDPGDKWLVTCFEVKVTELHGPFDGNMSHCFFNAQWTNSSSEEKKKNLRRSMCVTQNQAYVLGGHLLVTRHRAGGMT